MTVKTVDGTALASVKTIVGIAISSAKTINDISLTGGGGGGGLSILQTKAVDMSGTGSTSKTFTPDASLTAGSCLLLLFRTETGFTAVSDGTNTWNHDVNSTGGGQQLHAWSAPNNAATGTPTFTLTAGAGYTLFGGVFVEIGGANTSTPVETSATTTNSYGTDRYAGTLTISGDAYVFGWYLDSNTGLDDATYGLTPDAGYTRVAYITSSVNIGIIYQLLTAGTYNPHGLTSTGYGGNLGAAIAIK